MMMQPIENQREFSMKYCPDLEDHVIVMTVGGTNVKNKICLSSHLCPADTKISCGHVSSTNPISEFTPVNPNGCGATPAP